MKLILVDLDGTLVDTKEINYLSYKDAIEPFGFTIDFKYFCDYCNGRHYTDFLPQITTTDNEILEEIHKNKKNYYSKYLSFGRVNNSLVSFLKNRNNNCNSALVTTASRQNTYELLNEFNLTNLFDLIITREDISKSKPDPEGFIKAMKHFNVKSNECVIFEDSAPGIEAALKTGAVTYVVKGYN